MHLHQGVGEEFTALVPAIAVETGTHLERAWFARDLDPLISCWLVPKRTDIISWRDFTYG
jgi:hypothetical protein